VSEAHVRDEVVREVFRRYASSEARALAQMLPAQAKAQMNASADAMRDAVRGAAAGDSVGFGAAFDQARQVASGMDLHEIVDAVHVPDDAGEHEEALLHLLERIPDGWGRWISCSSGWFALLARAERELADVCPTFAVHQIKEKFGTLRLYVEFDSDDDLPAELRAAEPRCPSLADLAEILGLKDASRGGPVGDAGQRGYDTVFVPAHDEWSARVEAFRASDEGILAAADQDRRAAEFEPLVKTFENESATICDRCGLTGVLSCTAARFPWYAVTCDGCRDAGWVLAAEWKEWRRTQAD
jgi:hypothetical protein